MKYMLGCLPIITECTFLPIFPLSLNSHSTIISLCTSTQLDVATRNDNTECAGFVCTYFNSVCHKCAVIKPLINAYT